jgi:hypothetical protein
MSILILEAEEVAAGVADVVVPIDISMMTVEINKDGSWRDCKTADAIILIHPL